MRGKITKENLGEFMTRLAQGVRGPGTVYFTGGACAVWLGWRDSTIDIDLKFDPEPAGAFELLPKLKNALNINLELAAPDQFIPEVSEWRSRSQRVASIGNIDFYHYDFYAQALSKIERDHPQDQLDVIQMALSGLIDPDLLLKLGQGLSSQLCRFPAIDEETFFENLQRYVLDMKRSKTTP